nr:hypothetical protein B0A51_00979 [Rachicladosporium sp. CCFEE 5018]
MSVRHIRTFTLSNAMASKVAVAGSVNGKLLGFFTKLAGLQAKQNFAFVIVAGDLFADQDSTSEAENYEVKKLMKGEITVPVTTYFAIGRRELPEDVVSHLKEHDGELCPNLFALGRKGRVKTSEGFSIVAVGGAHTDGDVANHPYAALYTTKDASSAKGYNDADILVTSEWPSAVRYASAAGREIKPAVSADSIAELCTALKPRYHFSTGDAYFEREPFFHVSDPPRPITRFVSLAEFGNTEKRKWMYAFSFEPSASPPTVMPEGTTASPFTQGKKRKLDSQAESFNTHRFANGNGGDQYGGRGGKRMRRAPPKPTECYFCLSFNQDAAHMITAIGEQVYLTTSKGPLPLKDTYPEIGFPGHVLIIPVDHAPTLSAFSNETRDAVTSEMIAMKDGLQKMIASKSRDADGHARLGAVTWEISKSSGVHLQWQFLPIAASMIQSGVIEAAFVAEAENSEYSTKFLSSTTEIAEAEKYDYFKVMIWSEGLRKDILLPLDQSFRFDLQFGRRVLGKLLGLEPRTHWKDCPQSKAEEEADAEVMKEAFKEFDPSTAGGAE